MAVKKEAPSKSKFMVLKRRLGLRLWQTIGLLESLWYVTIINAPAGDIGRLTNEEIAASMDWEGDADRLVDVLVDTRWIDRSEQHRLVIHDWSEHAPAYLAGAFSKHGKQFADQSAKHGAKHGASDGAKHGASDGAKHGASDGALARPSPAQPSLASVSDSPSENESADMRALSRKRDQVSSAKDLGADWFSLGGRVRGLWDKSRYAQDGADGGLFWQVAWLERAGKIDPEQSDWSAASAGECARKSPVGQFRTVLARRMTIDAAELTALLRTTPRSPKVHPQFVPPPNMENRNGQRTPAAAGS